MEDWMYYQRVSWSTYRHLFAPFRHALHNLSYRTVASTSYQRTDIYFDHFAIHYKVSYRTITCSTFKRIDICVYHFAILVHQKVACRPTHDRHLNHILLTGTPFTAAAV